MSAKLLGLGVAAVVGTMHLSHITMNWGMEKAALKNETLKTRIKHITTAAAGALTFYAVVKEYDKILTNRNLVVYLVEELNQVNNLLLTVRRVFIW